MADNEYTEIIVACPYCETPNRIGTYSRTLRPRCGKCRRTFDRTIEDYLMARGQAANNPGTESGPPRAEAQTTGANHGHSEAPSEDRDLSTRTVICPGCGLTNRIRPHTPSQIPHCGGCSRSLADLSPWSPPKRKIEEGSPPESACVEAGPVMSGDLYGKIAVGFVAAVLVFFAAIGLLSHLSGSAHSPKPVSSAPPSSPRPAVAAVAKPVAKPANAVATPAAKPVPPVATALPKPEPPTVSKSPAPPPLNRKLTNGTMIKSDKLRGMGQLEVNNGLVKDAAVKVVRTDKNKCVAFFYVSANSTHKIKGLPDGEYDLAFCSGTDWDSANRSFTRDKRVSKFREPSPFKTTREETDEGVRRRYTILRVTLHPVVEGNAKIDPLSEAEFEQYQ